MNPQVVFILGTFSLILGVLFIFVESVCLPPSETMPSYYSQFLNHVVPQVRCFLLVLLPPGKLDPSIRDLAQPQPGLNVALDHALDIEELTAALELWDLQQLLTWMVVGIPEEVFCGWQ